MLVGGLGAGPVGVGDPLVLEKIVVCSPRFSLLLGLMRWTFCALAW